MPEKRDLIITVVQGTDFDYVAPFVRSLKRTGYRGEVVVFASSMKGDAIQKMESLGLTVISYPFVSKRIREIFFWPFWPFWRHFFGTNAPTGFKEMLAHQALPLFYRRHLLYLHFLRANRAKFDRVFLTDVRDVYFQADPFGWQPADGLHFFLLPAQNTVRSTKLSLNWDRKQFGNTEATALLDKVVSCAGTTFGDTISIIDYLSQMVATSLRARKLRKVTGGDDQGVHNFLIYENKLSRVTLHANGFGPVLTSAEPMTLADVRFNAEDRIIDNAGAVIPVIHQYDRVPRLKARLLAGL